MTTLTTRLTAGVDAIPPELVTALAIRAGYAAPRARRAVARLQQAANTCAERRKLAYLARQVDTMSDYVTGCYDVPAQCAVARREAP